MTDGVIDLLNDSEMEGLSGFLILFSLVLFCKRFSASAVPLGPRVARPVRRGVTA